MGESVTRARIFARGSDASSWKQEWQAVSQCRATCRESEDGDDLHWTWVRPSEA